MEICNNIFGRLNIQIFMIFVNSEYMIYSMYSIREGSNFGQANMIMLVSSTVNLLISLILYIMYLKNRINIDRIIQMKDHKEINTEAFLNKVKKEMRYILANLTIFFVYSLFYFIYIVFIVNLSQ